MCFIFFVMLLQRKIKANKIILWFIKNYSLKLQMKYSYPLGNWFSFRFGFVNPFTTFFVIYIFAINTLSDLKQTFHSEPFTFSFQSIYDWNWTKAHEQRFNSELEEKNNREQKKITHLSWHTIPFEIPILFLHKSKCNEWMSFCLKLLI